MKLLILCRESRLYSCQRLKQAAEERGYQVDILDPNRMLLTLEQGKAICYYQEGEPYDKQRRAYRLNGYCGVIGRFGTSSTTIGCNVLRHFELQGVPSLNSSSAFELARDKWRSLQQLQMNGIPIPNTQIAGGLVSSNMQIEQQKCPLVIKTRSGSQGVGVMLSEHSASAKSILDTLNSSQIPYLTQQFIPEAAGQDIRAFVIGGKVVASMLRQGQAGEFRANIHQGGSATAIQLSEAEKQLAINATTALGLAVSGVDLIRSKQGSLVLEVNASPGLEMIEKISGIAIAEQIIDYFSPSR